MEDKLSEAEIIERINKIAFYPIVTDKKVIISRKDIEAIQGLLDLYNKEKLNSSKLSEQLNKEKEKNKELEHQIQVEIEGRNVLVNLNENLKEELNKEKEMNAVQRKMLNDAFDRGWIHKDKIKEIIYPTPTNPISYEIQTSDMYKKLLELLEEE